MIRKIVIVSQSIPNKNLNDELQWFGRSLGLFGNRDKDSSVFRIFLELLKAARQERQISSDELAEKLSITRATVVYHLNALMDRGFVIQQKRRYLLSHEDLRHIINEMQNDAETSFARMLAIAKEIDEQL
ncbi:helix-turn-helix transcriptional regulator [Candidatus Woesearchaeota archaeon]|nr:helix-turn-helix transcriptional regulator [Candidatus Woesearchaeota archaeon]